MEKGAEFFKKFIEDLARAAPATVSGADQPAAQGQETSDDEGQNLIAIRTCCKADEALRWWHRPINVMDVNVRIVPWRFLA